MLSIRELRLLTELARRADRIMTREELFRLVWGREMRARRPVGRCLRAQAAGEARGGAARAGRSSTPTSGSATGWRPSVAQLATAGSHLVNTCRRAGAETLPDTEMNKETQVRTQSIGAVALTLAAALVIAACG